MIEFQTRSEKNGLEFFETLKAAREHAKSDSTVWKISFFLETGESVRLTKVDGIWQLSENAG